MEKELVDIIWDALLEFAHSWCPYCQSCIELDRYIDKSDIKRWVKEKGLQPCSIK